MMWQVHVEVEGVLLLGTIGIPVLAGGIGGEVEG